MKNLKKQKIIFVEERRNIQEQNLKIIRKLFKINKNGKLWDKEYKNIILKK